LSTSGNIWRTSPSMQHSSLNWKLCLMSLPLVTFLGPTHQQDTQPASEMKVAFGCLSITTATSPAPESIICNHSYVTVSSLFPSLVQTISPHAGLISPLTHWLLLLWGWSPLRPWLWLPPQTVLHLSSLVPGSRMISFSLLWT
jgi:hypothetical protein